MTDVSSSQEPKPTWQIVMRVVISILCVIAFILGALAFKVGAFFNFMLVALVIGVVLVIAARLPYIIYKQIDWGFLSRAFSKQNRGRWGQILPRILLYVLAATFVQIGIVKAQIPNDKLIPILGIVWAAAIILSVISLFPKKVGAKPMTIFSVSALAPMLFLLIDSLYPQLTSDGAVTLHSPFESDAYMFHAGHNTVVNYHMAHSSQKHAMDIVLIHANGKERDGPANELSSYKCFGAPLLAPIAGDIVKVVSDLPDKGFGKQPPQDPAGNHVVIKVDDTHYALLAHMKQGSPTVLPGDKVNIGDLIGACGNSGNTSSPHLHLQVQRYPDLFAKGGFTYPLRFDGTIRVRGAQVLSDDGLYYRRNDIMKVR